MKPKRRGSLKITRDRAPSAPTDMEHDMVVRRAFRAFVVEHAGRLAVVVRLDAKGARHAEMADQHRAVLQHAWSDIWPGGRAR